VSDSLATERLLLRRWKAEDRGPFAELNSDPEVMRYFPRLLSSAESDSFVDRIEQGFDENGFGLWALEISGRFAGYTGLNRTTFETPMGQHVEIGWRLARWAWGRGYATEAARCVLRSAYELHGISDVYSFTVESNTRSESVMRRIGMSRRIDLDFDHPILLAGGGRGTLSTGPVRPINSGVWGQDVFGVEPHKLIEVGGESSPT